MKVVVSCSASHNTPWQAKPWHMLLHMRMEEVYCKERKMMSRPCIISSSHAAGLVKLTSRSALMAYEGDESDDERMGKEREREREVRRVATVVVVIMYYIIACMAPACAG